MNDYTRGQQAYGWLSQEEMDERYFAGRARAEQPITPPTPPKEERMTLELDSAEADYRAVHLINGAAGQYIPQEFTEEHVPINCDGAEPGWHYPDSDRQILLTGPGSTTYYDTWSAVEGSAYYISEDGRRWTLFRDLNGNLWRITPERVGCTNLADPADGVYCLPCLKGTNGEVTRRVNEEAFIEATLAMNRE